MGTSIEYFCPDRNHYFDYPVDEPFISFYYSTNINSINVTCNPNAIWDVVGGVDDINGSEHAKAYHEAATNILKNMQDYDEFERTMKNKGKNT